MIAVQNKRRKNKARNEEEPLFPGYIFVRIDLAQPGWVEIKYTPGVRRIVSYDTEPVPVPEPVLEGIKVKLGGNKFVQKSIIPFRAGDRVQFIAGPFEGLEGIFTGAISGKERVKVLMEVLRQSVKVEAEIINLEKAAG